MSVPTFSKTGVSTFSFGIARVFPIRAPVGGQQIMDKAGGGQPKVADLGAEEQLLYVKVDNFSETNRDELLTFLRDSLINWSAFPFTWTDEGSNTSLVRYWNSKGILDAQEKHDDKYSVLIVLQVEIL